MSKWVWVIAAWAATSAAMAADVAATLQWSQRVELSPRVSGIVREVAVGSGERVRKGQALLVLDAAIYQARLSESRAVVARFREETAEAQRDLGRTQELYDRTVISTSELDRAKLRYARTKAQLDGAQARFREEQKNLADTVLRAPFDAVVVARLAEPGQNVVVGLQPQPLLVLAKAGEMAARFRLRADRAAALKPGQSVMVVVGKQDYPATVKNIGLEPVKDKGGTAYEADAIFAVQELLRPGTAAVVKLPE